MESIYSRREKEKRRNFQDLQAKETFVRDGYFDAKPSLERAHRVFNLLKCLSNQRLLLVVIVDQTCNHALALSPRVDLVCH